MAVTPRTGVSRAVAAATAAAATTLAMVTTSTLPVAAFVTPPAAFPFPPAWQRDTTTARITTTSASPLPRPKAAFMTMFSHDPIAIDASERRWIETKLRVTAGVEGGQQRFSSSLGRPLRSSSDNSDGSAPESSEGGEEAGDPLGDGPLSGMSESEKLREKLETIAKTPAPLVDGKRDGLTQKEQEELDELEEDRRTEEELDRLEASQNARSMERYANGGDEGEDDPGAEVRGARAKKMRFFFIIRTSDF